MKKVILFSIILFVGLVFVSCDTKEAQSDQEQQRQTEMLMNEANRQVGMPAMFNFQEKKLLKWIYELCDQENLVCYAYLVNEYKGEIGQYLGKCLGYGIPYSTQFSNPEKRVDYSTGSHCECDYNIKQAEPNGLFKPEGLSATWLIMIDEKGDPRPIYVEPAIIVSPFPLHDLKGGETTIVNSPNSVTIQGNSNQITQ